MSPGRESLALVLAAMVPLSLGALNTVDAQAATPATLYVSQTGLDSGSCTVEAPCATVSYALTQAASGATIEVSGTIEGLVKISSSITITQWVGGPAGSPGVLDGAGQGIVVVVKSGDVNLDQLTIENGGGFDQASGVYVDSGTVKISDCTISGGSAGAAIDNNGSTMTITNSTISGNTSGGIENALGAR